MKERNTVVGEKTGTAKRMDRRALMATFTHAELVAIDDAISSVSGWNEDPEHRVYLKVNTQNRHWLIHQSVRLMCEAIVRRGHGWPMACDLRAETREEQMANDACFHMEREGRLA